MLKLHGNCFRLFLNPTPVTSFLPTFIWNKDKKWENGNKKRKTLNESSPGSHGRLTFGELVKPNQTVGKGKEKPVPVHVLAFPPLTPLNCSISESVFDEAILKRFCLPVCLASLPKLSHFWGARKECRLSFPNALCKVHSKYARHKTVRLCEFSKNNRTFPS